MSCLVFQAPVEITPGLVVGMAWWYVVLAFFNYFENALLASDAAVAFSFRFSLIPLRVSPGQFCM